MMEVEGDPDAVDLDAVDPLDATMRLGSHEDVKPHQHRILGPVNVNTHTDVDYFTKSATSSTDILAADIDENFHIGPSPCFRRYGRASCQGSESGSQVSDLASRAPSQLDCWLGNQVESPVVASRSRSSCHMRSLTFGGTLGPSTDQNTPGTPGSNRGGDSSTDLDDTPVMPERSSSRARNATAAPMPRLGLGWKLGLMHQNHSVASFPARRPLLDDEEVVPSRNGLVGRSDTVAAPYISRLSMQQAHSDSPGKGAWPNAAAIGAGNIKSSLWRPPQKVRRTLSMFATPEQFLHEQLEDIDPQIAADTEPRSILGQPDCPIPTFNVSQDRLPRISSAVLCDLLDGRYANVVDELVVVDCRFEYEYNGGHIQVAVNINSKLNLEQELLLSRPDLESEPDRRRLVVFHCEYSAFRSPDMAAHLRRCDRQINMARYPALYYPDIVILHGGYSDFYASHGSRCWPQNYVEMNDSHHRQTREREMSRFRSRMRPHKPFRSASSASSTSSLALLPSAASSTDSLVSGANSESAPPMPELRGAEYF